MAIAREDQHVLRADGRRKVLQVDPLPDRHEDLHDAHLLAPVPVEAREVRAGVGQVREEVQQEVLGEDGDQDQQPEQRRLPQGVRERVPGNLDRGHVRAHRHLMERYQRLLSLAIEETRPWLRVAPQATAFDAAMMDNNIWHTVAHEAGHGAGQSASSSCSVVEAPAVLLQPIFPLQRRLTPFRGPRDNCWTSTPCLANECCESFDDSGGVRDLCHVFVCEPSFPAGCGL